MKLKINVVVYNTGEYFKKKKKNYNKKVKINLIIFTWEKYFV
jgi:hypothetical protein